MHAGFSYQNELPTLPRTFRKKTPSQTVAGIAGGELAGEPQPGADGLPIMGGQSASHPTRPIALLDTFRPSKNL